jgi:hypothetical protein
LERFTFVGIPSIILGGLIIHFLAGVKPYPNVPTLRELLAKRQSDSLPARQKKEVKAHVSSMGQARLIYRLLSMPDSFRHGSRRRARLKRLDSAGEVVQSSPPAARRKERPVFYHSLVRHK